jgi:hypothetical protein
MPLYQYSCSNHPEPLIIEQTGRITDPTPAEVPCPDCGQAAKRLWHGQKFYATVPGAHGGGPATR